MTSGVNKRILRRLSAKVGQRPKSRNTQGRKGDIEGVVYFPTECIGHNIKIEVLEK